MSKRDLFNVMMDHDINSVIDEIREAAERGCDTFLECYDDRTEWTYINEDNETDSGLIIEPKKPWASFDQQLLDSKVAMTRMIGYEVQHSRLHVGNHRGDRYDW
jgi:hypothetical protein